MALLYQTLKCVIRVNVQAVAKMGRDNFNRLKFTKRVLSSAIYTANSITSLFPSTSFPHSSNIISTLTHLLKQIVQQRRREK